MSDLVGVLREACRRERAQALFYRELAGAAETAGDQQMAERLNELLADEQHHVARVTARILELGESVEGEAPPVPATSLSTWLADAESREAAEVAWYEGVIDTLDDVATVGVLKEILASERNHLNALGGKWVAAEAPTRELEQS